MKRIDAKSEKLAESYGTELWEDCFENEDGQEYRRTVIRRANASAIVVENQDGTITMIEQSREAVGASALLEIPAGKIDQGEDPLEAAKRELREETGQQAKVWETIKEATLPSPGYTAEEISIFYARDLTEGTQSLDDDERIQVVQLELAEAIERTQDAKSLIGLLWLRARRLSS